jgi:hypothetical protein
MCSALCLAGGPQSIVLWSLLKVPTYVHRLNIELDLQSLFGLLCKAEPVFVNVYEAQESIPRNRSRQSMKPGGPVRPIGLSYLSAMLGIDSWAPYKIYKYGLCTHWLRPRNSPLRSPRIWAHIRWRYWSAKIDDIYL